MPEKPTELTLDTFDFRLDDDEETCLVKVTGQEGDRITISMDREQAEEFAIELCQILGLEPRDDPDADD
jgi:hypothetical protein